MVVVGIFALDSFGMILFGIISLLVPAFFIWIGAGVAAIEKGSFARSFLIALLITIITPIISLTLLAHPLSLLVINVFVTLALIKIVFDTGWRQSIITWIFSIIAEILVTVALLFALILV